MLVEGLKVPTGANFTFGFVNALVDSTGTPVLTSQGAVDFYNPSDGGQGVGGASTTNDWVVTNSYSPSPSSRWGQPLALRGPTRTTIFFSRLIGPTRRKRSEQSPAQWPVSETGDSGISSFTSLHPYIKMQSRGPGSTWMMTSTRRHASGGRVERALGQVLSKLARRGLALTQAPSPRKRTRRFPAFDVPPDAPIIPASGVQHSIDGEGYF